MNKSPIVLIVDDQEDNRFALKLALKKEGYEFIEAENGEDAVKKAIQYQPQIILMDAIMPILNGFEATKQIRRISSLERTPILMVTALNESTDRIHALESGVNDFVSKPFDKHEVLARCRSYIAMAQLNEKYINATENPITKLPNRAALLNDLSKIEQPVIIIFSIDAHETLNEFYSDHIMHWLEKEISRLASQFFPLRLDEYSLYNTRFGEFTFVMDQSKLDFLNRDFITSTVFEFYQKIRKEPLQFEDYEFDISVTLGVSYNDPSPFDNARTALKEAKKEKKPYLFADGVIEKSHKNISNNIAWIKKLKMAVSNDKIIPYFQPIYHNQNDQIEKYECLIRLKNEEGEIVSPFHFLEIAKKAKYYHQLTRIMFDKSIAVFADKNVEFSINISGSDVEHTELREYMLSTLDTHRSLGPKIVFELLEDENIRDFITLKQFIATVKSYGAKIAIDDFGSGYSNFTRLMEYQPDILKIDGSLIKDIREDPFSLNIVQTIKSFADKMGIKLVAEYVHNEEVFNIVKDIGIHYSQGYFISPPLQAEQIFI